VSLPAPCLVSAHRALKRNFDSGMQPVPEEDDDDSDSGCESHSSESSSSSSSSESSESSTAQPKLGSDSQTQLGSSDARSTSTKHELRHPLQNDPERLLAELEYVKKLHEQDKEFFTREIRNLRMLLFSTESTLQDRTAELEFILQERESVEKCKWEAAREREAAQVLREANHALRLELDGTRREYAEMMDVLEEAQRELLGVVPDGSQVQGQRERRASGGSGSRVDAVNQALEAPVEGVSPPATSATMARYGGIPMSVSFLRKRVAENEERFQSAYAAWSNENKHLRKVHQTQLKTLNDELKRCREEVQTLTTENRKLNARVNELKESLAASRKESDTIRRKSRELSAAPALLTSPSEPFTPQDKISVPDALKLIQKLNMRISSTALLLAKHLAPGSADTGGSTREAAWLLGGKELISRLEVAPRSTRALAMLMQIALTTWCGFHVHSWDLRSGFGEDSGRRGGPARSEEMPSMSPLEGPLSTIYRKLKTVGAYLVFSVSYCVYADE